MRTTLEALLATGRVLLADGATGTNYMEMGLGAGEAPELWNVDAPDKVASLHRRFVDAGADVILTNTFGCNRHRLTLHGAEHRVGELARAAATIAGEVAAASSRPVVVAGSVGPTGELFEPLGALTEEAAVAAFGEQIAALREGGADVAWIETMSAPEEVRAAARAAFAVGLPVRRDVLVRHRRAHDDGTARRATTRPCSPTSARRPSPSAPTVAWVRPTSWCRCWR